MAGSVSSGPANPPGATAERELAGLTRRLASLAYEALLLAAVFLIAGFVLLPWITPSTALGPGRTYLPPLPERVLSFAYYLGVGALYCTWFWSGGRRTLPMKTWRLRLVALQGGPVATKQALARYLAAWIGPLLGAAGYALWGGRAAFLVGLNFAWAVIDPERQFLHDRIARTRILVDKGKPPTEQ